jgi:hypothetical protein
MRTVNNQYKLLVKAWSILEEEQQLQAKSQMTSTVATHDADSDSPSSLGSNLKPRFKTQSNTFIAGRVILIPMS